MVSLKFGVPTTFEIKPLSIYEAGDTTQNPLVTDAPTTSTQL
jgi:hypothetical protein